MKYPSTTSLQGSTYELVKGPKRSTECSCRTSRMRRHADTAHRNAPNGDHRPPETPCEISPPSAATRKRSRRAVTSATRLGHPGWDLPRNRLNPRAVAGFCIIGGTFLFLVHIIIFRTAFTSSGNQDTGTSTSLDDANADNEDLHADGVDAESFAIYEDQLARAMDIGLTELGSIDREKFTIRVNTWRRNEQLVVSLNHHSKCEGVAQIQVIWCDSENEPPGEVLNHPSGKVVVERHIINSLNERFHILTEDTPTLGILSMDDDVLRPCDAIDAGFFRWVSHPERLVGYDARLHIPDMKYGHFEYGYKSATEKYNRYSITLPRYCFVHRDYLDLYMTYAPGPILERVERTFECEDIALSFFVSALTNGDPPLLADFWATKTQIKLYSPVAISSTSGHKKVRDQCVEDFLTMLRLRLGLKTKLLVHELWHENNIMFGYGAEPDPDLFTPHDGMLPRQASLAERVQKWMKMSKENLHAKVLSPMMLEASVEAMEAGLLDGTSPWKARWKEK